VISCFILPIHPILKILLYLRTMQLTVKLIQLLPLQTGNGKNGQWKKQDIIVETDGTYPKKICVSIWGDKIQESQLQIGGSLKIDFDVESREYNGRWYTDVKAWKVEPVNGGGSQQIDRNADTSYSDINSNMLNEPMDDLPF
jgi:hypothetical protein